MNSRARFLGKAVATASVSLATLMFVVCDRSQQAGPASVTAASPAATTEKVFVEFEGPWVIVADPKDANSVLAVAPKTKLHNDLFVDDQVQVQVRTDSNLLIVNCYRLLSLERDTAQVKFVAEGPFINLFDEAGTVIFVNLNGCAND